MRNVLVTGGCGFIGSNFIRRLLENRPDVFAVAYDSLTYAGRLGNISDTDPNRRSFIEGDISDPKRVAFVFEKLKIDTVVHFAAESHVDRSIVDPEAFMRTNVMGTFMLLEAARKAWVGRSDVRFHHVSTDEVYGSLGPSDPPFKETTPYDPSSPYSASKAASDHLVRAYHRTYGLPVTISNCSNNYGPYQYPEKLIPLVIQNAIEGKEIPVYGDGKQIRDWLYVDDHCDAILEILKSGRAGETYNVGGSSECQNLWIIRQICRILDQSPQGVGKFSKVRLIRHVTDRPGHDRRYAVDCRKLREELGWKPRHSMADGLKKTVDWYLENQAWITSIQERSKSLHWLKEKEQR